MSIVITIVSYILIWCVVEYLYSHGLWRNNVRAHNLVRTWENASTVLAVLTAILGLKRDVSKPFAFVALCVSLFNFVFYVA